MFTGFCAAKNIYVDIAGPNDPGTGSFSDPFRRIQDGIDAATDGDTVVLAPGIYSAGGNHDLDFSNGLPAGQTRAITVRSTDPNDPDVVSATIIDANGAGRGFYFHSGEDANSVVAGLTLRDCNAGEGSGGGFYCAGSSPVITNCNVLDCWADWGGGGLYFYNSSPVIRNCLIAGNSVGYLPGAVELVLCSEAQVINCTISGNRAQRDFGGVYCYNSTAAFSNCIIWGNEYQQIGPDEGPFSVSYSDVQGGWSGEGNLAVDPNFVFFDPNGSHELWDLHLKSEFGRWDSDAGHWTSDDVTSSCIDAGDPNSVWSSETWPNGKRVNMGAYGGTIQAGRNGNPADFDVDGKVGFGDFADFAGSWALEQFCIQDLDGDGFVGWEDLAVVAENWLWRRQ